MAVTVTAVLAGTSSPPDVQVTVEGLTIGARLRLVGVRGSWRWDVRGGQVDAVNSSQVIQVDTIAPINRPITYQALVDGEVVAESAPIVVPYADGDYVLESLTGSVQVPVEWYDNGDARSVRVEQHLSYVAGRRNPVVRFSPAGGEDGAWSILTADLDATLALRDLIAVGAPVIMRSTGDLADQPPVQIVLVSGGNTRTLVGMTQERLWSLPWVEVDDPLGATSVAVDTWLDVDNAFTGSTWALFDAAYPGTTWGAYNRMDFRNA